VADLWDIRQGDCLGLLREMPSGSVDAVVTDPPYGLGFMGKAWDHGVPGKPFWAEALRVAKPGAHLLAFGGARTYHRLTCAVEDVGWEIRDCLVWAYASGFPKSHNLNGEWNGWGTALKPAWEPIVMARKPLAGTVAANVLRHGTGALNIDATRIEGSAGSGVWGSSNATADPTFNASATKHEFRSEQHPAGRWPANVVLTDPIFDGGVDGVVGGGETGPGAFPAQRGPTGVTFPLGAGGWQPRDTDSGTYSRFFLIPKAARSDREPVLRRQLEERVLETQGRPEGRTLNGDGTITTHGDTRKARENLHPTVKPVDLMRHLVRLVTPPGGTVLDCFLGSGTTAIACELEGFAWIGMEREPEYVAIAEARLNGTQRGFSW